MASQILTKLKSAERRVQWLEAERKTHEAIWGFGPQWIKYIEDVIEESGVYVALIRLAQYARKYNVDLNGLNDILNLNAICVIRTIYGFMINDKFNAYHCYLIEDEEFLEKFKKCNQGEESALNDEYVFLD